MKQNRIFDNAPDSSAGTKYTVSNGAALGYGSSRRKGRLEPGIEIEEVIIPEVGDKRQVFPKVLEGVSDKIRIAINIDDPVEMVEKIVIKELCTEISPTSGHAVGKIRQDWQKAFLPENVELRGHSADMDLDYTVERVELTEISPIEDHYIAGSSDNESICDPASLQVFGKGRDVLGS
jgi:hypothetical protein